MVAFSAAVLLLASAASGASARQLLQTNSTKTVRWFEPANGRLNDERVPVGGSITFEWSGTHDLWEIPSLACPSAFANGTGITQLAPSSRGGSKTVQFSSAGVRYFSCSVGDHCEDGQLIAVYVGGVAPAPGPSRYRGGSSENYGSDGQPIANYGGSSYGEDDSEEDDSGYGSGYGSGPSSSGYGSTYNSGR